MHRVIHDPSCQAEAGIFAAQEVFSEVSDLFWQETR